ncbi:MAG: PKD domain-containing protein [Bacteroidetes bacterium]|nr:PKD domain-containing protein [Bacteroidota bacterium]
MKKILLICLALLVLGIKGQSQNQGNSQTLNDTANYPYWISMMQDPSVNFFKVQSAFNTYWKDRTITKGCGWKPFKRWEYMTKWRVYPDGERQEADATYNAYHEYVRSNRSTNGNWISLGPSIIPDPGPAGYEGLGRINTVGWHPTNPTIFYIGAPSGGLWQTSDGGSTWISHTDSLPTLGVSSIIVDRNDPNTLYIGTGDRDAGDAAGLGVFKSTNNGTSWILWNTGMGNKTVGRMLQHPTNAQIFLAATNGGVYRSTNAGANWTLSFAGNFQGIEFKPGDPNIVYAVASGNFYRSSDDGVTFSMITSGLPGGQRAALAVSPAAPNTVYVLISGNDSGFKGFYRSTDAGLSFSTQATTPNMLDWSCDGSGSGGQGWYDLAVTANPTNADYVYIGGVDIWRSTNGGSAWSIRAHWYGGCSVQAVHADCHFLGYSPSGVLFATVDGGVYSSNDNGVTWTDHTEGMTIGQIYKLGQGQKIKDQVINGFQDNGTYTYMGSHWEATGGGDGMECIVDYDNASYTYYSIYYGSIYRRYNNNSEKQIAGQGVYGITESGDWVTPYILHPTNPQTMFIGYKNVWRSTNIRSNNTISWTQITDNLAGNNNANLSVLEQSPANTNILYAARSDHRLFRSDNCNDATPTWIDLTSSLPMGGYTPSDLAAHPTDPNTLYMTISTKVFKSTNKGISWTNITGGLPSVNMNTIAYYKNALEGLYVGTDAGVYYKDQSLSGWISFSKGLPVNSRITEVEIYYNADTVSKEAIRASTYGRGLWGSDMYHAAPVADFMADQTLVPIGCPVNFTDLSSGVPTQWSWTFTGAIPSTSNLKNPQNIAYITPGIYPVTLIISNEFGTDTKIKTGYISVSSTLVPQVNFSCDKNVLCEGEISSFHDSSLYCPYSWVWDFQPNTVTYLNGTSATDQNPVVQYDHTGSYSVTLTVANACGSNTLTKWYYIMYGGYTIPFTETFESGLTTQGWTIGFQDGNITWDTVTITGTAPGNKAVWMNLFDDPKINRRDQLISPPLDFTIFSSVSMTFEHAYAQQSIVRDSLIVKISDDCGLTWTRVLSAGPDETPNVFATHSQTNAEFFPQSAYDWCGSAYGTPCYSLDLTPWAGKRNIKVLFESYNRHGNNLFIDNINISGPVGIHDPAKDNKQVMIYPNPNEGIFTIFIPDGSESLTMSVINPQGQVMFAEQFSAKTGGITRQLDLSGFAKDVYYIRLVSSSKTFIEKVIIR